MNPNISSSKSSHKFICSCCDYSTSRQSQYDRHITTAKHLFLMNPNEKVPRNNLFECKCGKIYKHLSSLCAHKQKCSHKPSTVNILENTFTPCIGQPLDSAMIVELVKQNQEFKDLLLEQNKQMIELAGKIGNSTINNNNIKNQQNNFNLQFFLNETCKDAICINDFIKDLNVSFRQLENIGQNGYVAGITDVILTQLKTMDITKRPLHCTDLKRDTMYIKETNEWVKDDDEHSKMIHIFRRIANTNLRTIQQWSQDNPNSQITDCKEHTFCIGVMLNSLGAIGDIQAKYDNKVLKCISKLVHVDRNP